MGNGVSPRGDREVTKARKFRIKPRETSERGII
jgi:hypothetical protein